MCFHNCVFVVALQDLGVPRWQQLASRPLSVSAGLCNSKSPMARADGTFKVTMVPGDGVGPELMTAVKDVFKVLVARTETEYLVPFVTLSLVCLQSVRCLFYIIIIIGYFFI